MFNNVSSYATQVNKQVGASSSVVVWLGEWSVGYSSVESHRRDSEEVVDFVVVFGDQSVQQVTSVLSHYIPALRLLLFVCKERVYNRTSHK